VIVLGLTGSIGYVTGGTVDRVFTGLASNASQDGSGADGAAGIRIVGGYSQPHRPLTSDEREAIAAEIDNSRADVVWVGISSPKQERWMAMMRPLLQAPVLIGVGAAFDFHSVTILQAPRWIQRSGLEWLFRLLTEPRRLWRR